MKDIFNTRIINDDNYINDASKAVKEVLKYSKSMPNIYFVVVDYRVYTDFNQMTTFITDEIDFVESIKNNKDVNHFACYRNGKYIQQVQKQL